MTEKAARRYGADDPNATKPKSEPILIDVVHTFDTTPPTNLSYRDHLSDIYFRLEIIRRRSVSVKIYGFWSGNRIVRREIFPKDAIDLAFDLIEVHAQVRKDTT